MHQLLQQHRFHSQLLAGYAVQGALLSQLVIQGLHQMSLYEEIACRQELRLKPEVPHELNLIQVVEQLIGHLRFECESEGASRARKLLQIVLS